MKYKVTYDYDAPGPAGPFRGAMPVERQYKRGERIAAPFGQATVRSCRVANPTPSPWRK